MVNVIGVPVHPLAIGVTVMVETTGVFPVFEAMNDGIFPTPLSARPMDELLFVQLYVVFGTVEPEKLMAVVEAPAHSV